MNESLKYHWEDHTSVICEKGLPEILSNASKFCAFVTKKQYFSETKEILERYSGKSKFGNNWKADDDKFMVENRYFMIPAGLNAIYERRIPFCFRVLFSSGIYWKWETWDSIRNKGTNLLILKENQVSFEMLSLVQQMCI